MPLDRAARYTRTSRSRLLCLLENLDDSPPLGGGQRPGLHDQYPVSDRHRVGRVMRLELVRAADHLAVQGVLNPILDGHDHGLVHLVAHDPALAGLAVRCPHVLAHALALAHADVPLLFARALIAGIAPHLHPTKSLRDFAGTPLLTRWRSLRCSLTSYLPSSCQRWSSWGPYGCARWSACAARVQPARGGAGCPDRSRSRSCVGCRRRPPAADHPRPGSWRRCSPAA